MPTNQQIHLDNRPEGEATLGNFKLVTSETPPLQDNQVLVRHHYMSLDPYMRGRMNDSKSYTANQPVGAVFQGRHGGRGGREQAPQVRGGRQGGGLRRLAGIQRGRCVRAGVAQEGRHHARAAVALPGRGRNAGRHGLVRAGEDHRAQGRRHRRRHRRQRRGGQRLRCAGQGARLPRGGHRRRPRQVQVRGPTSWASTPASTTASTRTSRA